MARRLALALALAGLAAPGSAAAQGRAGGDVDGFSLDRIGVAAAGDPFLVTPSARIGRHLGLDAAMILDLATRPLVLARPLGAPEVPAVVSDRLLVRVEAAIGLADRLQLDLGAPVVVAQDGDEPLAPAGGRLPDPDSPVASDLRIGARVRVVGAPDDALQLALAASILLPVGDEASWAGEGHVSGRPDVLLSGDHDALVWSLVFGGYLAPRSEVAGVPLGSQLRWQLAAAVRPDLERRIQIGPEISIAITPEEVRPRNTSAELLLGARLRASDELALGLGAGPGLTPGYGTPEVRALASLTFSARPASAPRDGDGS
jgi:hypothetical protein